MVGYVPEAVRDPVDQIRSADELIPIVALLHRWITLYVARATGVGLEVGNGSEGQIGCVRAAPLIAVRGLMCRTNSAT